MDIKTLALIFAVAAVAIAGFLLMQTQSLLTEVSTAVSEIPAPGEATSADALALTQLPETVEGFERREYHPRVEPLLGGEEYSSLARFVPLEDSEFAGAVSGVGIMFYRFSAPEYVPPGLAIVSLGNALGSFSFEGYEVQWFEDEATGQNVYFLVADTALIQVLSVPTDNQNPDGPALEAAALAVLKALIEQNP